MLFAVIENEIHEYVYLYYVLRMLAVCSDGHKLTEKLPTNELITDDS